MDRPTLEKFLKQATTKPICKPYVPFFKLALDSLEKNPIISYWTLCYILETALKSHSKPGEEFRNMLLEIMSVMEKEKKARTGDPLFSSEAEAKKFIEEYGKKLAEKAEENEELLENFDIAYRLYLAASNIFEMFTVFVKDDPENAKRVKFCKWRAVENFKKKKEAAENPLPKPPATDSDDAQEEPNELQPGPSGMKNDSACPYPTGGPGSSQCPYPPVPGGGTTPFPPPPASSSVDSNPASEFDPFAPGKFNDDVPAQPAPETKPTPPVPAPRTTPSPSSSTSSVTKPPDQMLKETLAALKLTESDSKRAELLCESALYAIKAEDFLTAVETLQQTLELIYKRVRK